LGKYIFFSRFLISVVFLLTEQNFHPSPRRTVRKSSIKTLCCAFLLQHWLLCLPNSGQTLACTYLIMGFSSLPLYAFPVLTVLILTGILATQGWFARSFIPSWEKMCQFSAYPPFLPQSLFTALQHCHSLDTLNTSFKTKEKTPHKQP